MAIVNPMPMPAPELDGSRQTEIVDGYLVDPETGEILGLADLTNKFAVTDEITCDWVMNKMLEAEADVASVDHTPIVLHARAVVLNAEKLKKEKQRRIDYLHFRFDQELGEYARERLKGAKTKTLKTLFGTIALRIVKGGVRVDDAGAALSWAKLDPEAKKTAIKVVETFQISGLTKAKKEAIQKVLRFPRLRDKGPKYRAAFAGFRIQPDEEKIDVKVEVGK